MTSVKRQRRSRRASAVRALLVIAALLFLSINAGCSLLPPDKLPYAKLSLPYERTRLGATTAMDVLNFARDPGYQFLSGEAEPVLVTQSETGVAYSGRSKNGRKIWLDLIVFDESRMTAGRKYFFCVDEQATTDPDNAEHHFFLPRKGIVFDSQFAIDPAVLTAPYATEEAQKTAILKWLAARFQNDVAAVVGSPKAPAQGNQQVVISGLMVNQIFQGLFAELAQGPGLAKNLSADRGIQFPHASLGTGRIRMLVANDIGTVTIRVNLPLAPRRER